MSMFTIRSLRNIKNLDVYRKLLLGEDLSRLEQEALLKIAIVLANSSDSDLKKFGYRIILNYSNRFRNYLPLYDYCINKNYAPIVKLIEDSTEGLCSGKSNKFLNLFLSSYIDGFKKDEIYLTEQQVELNENFLKSTQGEATAVIAPTSYGKSELILSALKSSGNICILVPTKALIAQTKKRVLSSMHFDGEKTVITHPEMYSNGISAVVAILTQERLIRLLQINKKLHFSYVFIDEAHNLLEDDDRSRLLASAVIFLDQGIKMLFLNFFLHFWRIMKI